MALPEAAEQLVVGDVGGSVHHQHHLVVPGAPGAHLLVGGVGRVPAGVAHGRGVHAVRLPEVALGAPEAAHAEDGALGALGERRLERSAEHEVARRHRDPLLPAGQGVLGGGHGGLAPREETHGEIETSATRYGSAMASVAELPLPEFDYLDTELRGERFHRTMIDLARRSWLVKSDLGYFVLDRESAAFFLRTKSATFPGMKIAELFEVEDGPLYEEMRRNILHINGDAHRRLRNLVNPAFTPRVGRPLAAGDARTSWSSSGRGWRRRGRCEFVADFAKPYPSLTIATVMGAPLEDAPRLHDWSNWIQRQFDPPSLIADRARIEQRGERVLRVVRGDAGGAARRPARRPGVHAPGRRGGGRHALRRGVHEPGAERARGRRGHHAVAAHPRHAPVRRPSRTSGSSWPSDPELAPQAVEEVLRYEPITPFTARIMVEDVEYRDVTFPEGHGGDGLRLHREPRRGRGPAGTSTSRPSATRASRSPSARACTTASARTSRAPSFRRRWRSFRRA